MKIKKILLLCLLPLMGEMLFACCNCDDTPYAYRFDQMFVYNLDNSGKNAIETSAAETGKTSYGIRIKFTTLMAAVPADNNSFFYLPLRQAAVRLIFLWVVLKVLK